jgi:hypothetical protein
MSFLGEFDGNGTDPEVPLPYIIREVIEMAVQLFVDRLDLAPKIGGLDVLALQTRTCRKHNRVSGVRQEPAKVILAQAQRVLAFACRKRVASSEMVRNRC